MPFDASSIQEFAREARKLAANPEDLSYLITKFVETHAPVYKSGLDNVMGANADSGVEGISDDEGLNVSSYVSGGSTDDSAAKKRKLDRLVKSFLSKNNVSADFNAMSSIAAAILPLITRLRHELCPHTRPLPESTIRWWDKEFVFVLLFSVFREQPSISWNRLLCQLMESDLNEVEPYDGSKGPVKRLFFQCLHIPACTIDFLLDSSSSINVNKRLGGTTVPERVDSIFNRLAAATKEEDDREGDGRADRGTSEHQLVWAGASVTFNTPSALILSEALDGWTLLHYLAACSLSRPRADLDIHAGPNRYRHAIQSLLTYGIRVSEPDLLGRTPLHIAASCLNVECVQALVAMGAA